MRATTSPDDESERSVIPPIGETGGSAISAACESGGAATSSDDASEMISEEEMGELLQAQAKKVDSPLEIVG